MSHSVVKVDMGKTSVASPEDFGKGDSAETPGYRGFITKLLGSQLLLLTILNAFDGNALAMGTTGAIRDPAIAFVYGLTCIAGVGAFTVAVTEFGNGDFQKNRMMFAALTGITTAAVVSAVALGGIIGKTFQAMFIPLFGGAAVFTIGLMIMGVKIPSYKWFPTPLVLVTFGILLEVVNLWW
jgi:hypothetical protein